jgi:hypothetical protein
MDYCRTIKIVLALTLCRLAMFGKAASNVNLETQTSKQLNDSLNDKCPNIAKRLLAAGLSFSHFDREY